MHISTHSDQIAQPISGFCVGINQACTCTQEAALYQPRPLVQLSSVHTEWQRLSSAAGGSLSQPIWKHQRFNLDPSACKACALPRKYSLSSLHTHVEQLAGRVRTDLSLSSRLGQKRIIKSFLYLHLGNKTSSV